MTRRTDVFARVAAGTRRISPEARAISAAIARITAMPEWAIVLDHLDSSERAKTAASDEGDAGALLRAAGRRSLLRELERLDERVIDDGPSDQRE